MWPRNARVCDVFCDLFANCDRFGASAIGQQQCSERVSEREPPPFAETNQSVTRLSLVFVFRHRRKQRQRMLNLKQLRRDVNAITIRVSSHFCLCAPTPSIFFNFLLLLRRRRTKTRFRCPSDTLPYNSCAGPDLFMAAAECKMHAHIQLNIRGKCAKEARGWNRCNAQKWEKPNSSQSIKYSNGNCRQRNSRDAWTRMRDNIRAKLARCVLALSNAACADDKRMQFIN